MTNVETAVSAGDTAWVLTASALVLFMTLPGLALFYGGLVRARNLLSVFMHCFVLCCVVSVLWVIFGYSLAFAPGGPWIGGGSKLWLADVGGIVAGTHVPESAFAIFQMTFAVITPALIVGAFAERISFPFLILFAVGWLAVVYAPVAHWVWGHGWLADRGVIDFAGGIVVHTTAWVSALVCAVMVGPRRGFPDSLIPPHSPGLTMAGAGMLWFGWFGFNGGSASHADGGAALALINTHLAAAAGALTWAFVEGARIKKITMLGFASGLVAGLVAITPAAGFVSPTAALLIGIAAGGICYGAVLLKGRLGYDDALDAFGVHGVGGAAGALLTGLFARAAYDGGHAGGLSLLGKQAIGVAAAGAWAAIVTFVLLKAIDLAVGLRVDAEVEHDGLDGALHGESAYASPGSVAHGAA